MKKQQVISDELKELEEVNNFLKALNDPKVEGVKGEELVAKVNAIVNREPTESTIGEISKVCEVIDSIKFELGLRLKVLSNSLKELEKVGMKISNDYKDFKVVDEKGKVSYIEPETKKDITNIIVTTFNNWKENYNEVKEQISQVEKIIPLWDVYQAGKNSEQIVTKALTSGGQMGE